MRLELSEHIENISGLAETIEISRNIGRKMYRSTIATGKNPYDKMIVLMKMGVVCCKEQTRIVVG